MKAKAFVMIPHSNKKATEIKWMVAPLVMCKDCKWRKEEWKLDGNCWCGMLDRYTREDFFCADGEKEENNAAD